jgi:hypothetical protein
MTTKRLLFMQCMTMIPNTGLLFISQKIASLMINHLGPS